MRVLVKYILIVLVLTSSEFCPGEELLPAQILEKCTAAYKTMDTYKAEGTVVSNVEINEGKTTVTVHAVMRSNEGAGRPCK